MFYFKCFNLKVGFLHFSATPLLYIIDRNKKREVEVPNIMIEVLWVYRISGDTALDKNIHESVSAQIKKNFAKSKWKVSGRRGIGTVEAYFAWRPLFPVLPPSSA